MAEAKKEKHDSQAASRTSLRKSFQKEDTYTTADVADDLAELNHLNTELAQDSVVEYFSQLNIFRS